MTSNEHRTTENIRILISYLNFIYLKYSDCKFYKQSHSFLLKYSHFSICATCVTSADSRNHSICNVRNNFKLICVLIYMKNLLSQVLIWRYTLMGHIMVICATCGTSSTNCQIAISQQEIVQTLRKFAGSVINTYKIQIFNQISYILGKFVVV